MLETYGHDLIRKYVVAFGTLFNSMELERFDSPSPTAGKDLVQTIKVPLQYSPKDKMLARSELDPNTDRQVAVTLPRMGFEMVNMSYDSSRKLSKNRTVGHATGGGVSLNTPVPYNFDFDLYIAVKNTQDGTRLVEQILPYFTPEFNVTVNLVPGVNSAVDIPIVYRSISKEDSYEGEYLERRAIIWTLSFTVKGYLFGAVKDKKRIEEAIVNVFNDTPDPAVLLQRYTATEDGVNIEEF